MRFVLADVNIWLAIMLQQHPHHQLVLDWWKEDVLANRRKVAFCRITQLALLRLLTNKTVMGKQRRNYQDAYAHYSHLLAADSVIFVREPEGIEAHLKKHCRMAGSSSNFWTDSYLAAFAATAGFEFVTLDRGFRRFDSLDLKLLQN